MSTNITPTYKWLQNITNYDGEGTITDATGKGVVDAGIIRNAGPDPVAIGPDLRIGKPIVNRNAGDESSALGLYALVDPRYTDGRTTSGSWTKPVLSTIEGVNPEFVSKMVTPAKVSPSAADARTVPASAVMMFNTQEMKVSRPAPKAGPAAGLQPVVV